MIKKLIENGKKNNIKIEVLEFSGISSNITIFNKKLEKFSLSNNVNYHIKSLYKGKVLNISIPNLNNIDKIINAIKRNSEISDNIDKTEFAKPIDIKEKKIKDLNLDLNKIKEYLLTLNDYKKQYPNLKTIISYFNYGKSKKSLVNEDVNLHDENQSISIYVELVFKSGKKIETDGLSIFAKEFSKKEFEEKLINKLNNLNNKLNSVIPSSMKTKVLLTNESMYDIFKAFLKIYFAKTIRFNTSPLSGKLNIQVFSDKITIIEDPANENMVTSKLFDSEGTKTNYKEIVKKGVFKTILYDNKEAILAKTESTGNADWVSNCYIKPGGKPFEELIKIMDNGVIIDRIDGIHAGIKTLTGEISLQSQGYIVKNGKKEGAIKMFVMTTNLFELLNNVISVGNDLEMFDSTGGCPSMLVDNIDISGN